MVRQIDLNHVPDDVLRAASFLICDMTGADGKCPIDFRQAVGTIQTLSDGKKLPDFLGKTLKPGELYHLIVHGNFHAHELNLYRQEVSGSSHPAPPRGIASRRSGAPARTW